MQQWRSVMKTIVFFNNKGGVGKTTLACNVASYLQNETNLKIILIDADPQCNATQLYFSDNQIENIYNTIDSKNTLYYILKNIEDGESKINEDFEILRKRESKYRTDIIVGHPNLSMLEDRLSNAWKDLIGLEIGGARITNWMHQLLIYLKKEYDIAIIDVGPSLGALNRSVLLASDYFFAPLGCDIFSILGIENISTWIDQWSKSYTRSISNIKEGRKASSLDNYKIITDISNKFMLCGFTVQQYVTKTIKKGEQRAVKAYDDIKREMPRAIGEKLAYLIPPHINKDDLEYISIPYLYSLIPMSQSNHCPIYRLTGKEGIVGNQYLQVAKYRDTLSVLCKKLLHNIQFDGASSNV